MFVQTREERLLFGDAIGFLLLRGFFLLYINSIVITRMGPILDVTTENELSINQSKEGEKKERREKKKKKEKKERREKKKKKEKKKRREEKQRKEEERREEKRTEESSEELDRLNSEKE